VIKHIKQSPPFSYLFTVSAELLNEVPLHFRKISCLFLDSLLEYYEIKMKYLSHVDKYLTLKYKYKYKYQVLHL